MTELRNVSALVVEDEFIIAMDLQDMLADWGFRRVAVAHDVTRARAMLASDGADLVITDYHFGGGETSERLVAEAQWLGATVLLLTGRSLEPELLAGLGNPPVMDKPVQPERLRQTLIKLMEHR